MRIKSLFTYGLLGASITINILLMLRPQPSLSSDINSKIKLSELGKTNIVIGQLQHPIDEIIHVEGRLTEIIEPWWPRGDAWMDVESVNGKALPAPVNMKLVIMYQLEKSTLAIGDRVHFDAVEIPSIRGNSKAEIQLVKNYLAGKNWDPPSWPSVRSGIDTNLYTVGI